MVSLVLTVIVVTYSVFYLLKKYVSNKKLPAGPIGLPFIGYTPFLTLSPHLKLTQLSKTYGNVFSMKLGFKNVVFLNDWESIKEALKKDELLGRPDNFFGDGLFDNKKNIFNGSGTFWKEHVRLALRVFGDLGFGKQTMENNIKDEIITLLKEIDKRSEKAINIHDLLISSVSNNICYFLFGHSFDYNDPLRKKIDFLLENLPPLFQIPFMISVMPILLKLMKLPFLKSFMSKTVHKIQEFEKLIDDEIQKHELTLDENDTKDYFNGFLVERKKRKSEIDRQYFTNSVLNSNSMAFVGAGSDAVRTTLDWLLKHISYNMEIQRAIQKEIDSVVGRERLPSWPDREFMPLTQAAILETLRWASPLPLNIPRNALKDTTILGHSIPKDTIVIANFWAINRDPKLWENPNEFNPYRFLTDEGKLRNFEALVPFSFGKRWCVGETLAKFELFLYFTILLQRYEISIPDDEKTSFDMWLTITLQPTQVPILVFNKR